MIAQLAVAAHPERVDSLVLVACDAFEVFPPGAYRLLFRLARVPGVIRLLGAALSLPGFARSRLGFGALVRGTSRLGGSDRLLADRLIRRDLCKLISGSSRSQTLRAARSFRDYDRPVLVVWAAEDRLFPRSLGQRLAEAFPRGRMVVVPGSRTFVPVDQPRPLARLIGEFLEREVPT
ncbi:MAG TPA: alpha/beta fold hydrolase [Amycolatopsis sp.]|nr:alpha/beta fold hydrolase [Amycolatopsis sp.]